MNVGGRARRTMLSVTVAMAVAAAASSGRAAIGAGGQDIVRVGGTCPWLVSMAIDVAEQMSENDARTSAKWRFEHVTESQIASSGAQRMDVLLHYGDAAMADMEMAKKLSGDDGAIWKCRSVGTVQAAVVMNKANDLDAISVGDLRALLTGGPVCIDQQIERVLGRRRGTVCEGIVRRRCLLKGGTNESAYPPYGRLYVVCESREEIVRRVKANHRACGLVVAGRVSDGDVKEIPVVWLAEEPVGAMAEGKTSVDHPLCERIVVIWRPGGGAERFASFCLTREGADVLDEYGVMTGWHVRNRDAQARIKQARTGTGVRVSVIGTGPTVKAVADLSVDFVRSKEVMQAICTPVASDVLAVGAFVTGSSSESEDGLHRARWELLLLDDKPSGRAMELHGEKWLALGVDEKGQPTGGGPKEYVLAGRAVAVIVNPANKLESLTLDQVRAIFRGDADDWNVIGGTGLKAAGARPGRAVPRGGGPAPRGGARKDGLPIRVFGLRPREAATGIFEAECAARDTWKRVKVAGDTAAVVQAVSMDPQAIGFVDLAEIPGLAPAALAGEFAAAGQNVKVLGIRMDAGGRDEDEPGDRAVLPTAENIRNASYPLSQRYFLYVHPKASDTAKDFAAFIATCGGSEANPYTDPVKAVMETYLEHGLIPLADAAIRRAAKEALAEAARAERSRDPGRSRRAAEARTR